MDLSQDFCDLLAAFDQAGARYLLIGGYAVSAHSKPRYTKDIDIWIDSDPANLERVGAALQAFGAPEQAIHDVRTCADTEIVWFLRGEVRRSDYGIATKRYVRYIGFMGRTITQRELRNDSGAVLREVQAGHTIIVTRNGVPVAELRPIHPRQFVPRAIIAEAARSAPRVDADRLRRDLDAVVDQSVDG
jgi:prevent-host-death family protein